MHKGFLRWASVMAFLAVALGAMASHGLKDSVSDIAVNIFETGVRYQFYHAIALFLVAIIYRTFPGKLMKAAGWFFIAGIILFSGSLYILTYVKAAVLPGYKWVGPITPIGGICFLAGWVCIFIGSFYGRRSPEGDLDRN